MLPFSIERAHALLGARRNECDLLSNNARLLLNELLRATNASDPRKSIRISTQTLCKHLRLSARTIYRIKSELEELGWITRHQLKSRRLGMQISDVFLTDLAIQRLELDSTAHRPKQRHQDPSHLSAVPDELSFLLSFGLSKPSIFHLMGLATEKKKRLGDIANCLRGRLKGVDKIFGYLRKVILSDSDIDWAAKRAAFASSESTNKGNGGQEHSKETTLGVSKEEHEQLKKTLTNAPHTNINQSHRFSVLNGTFYVAQMKDKGLGKVMFDVSRLYELLSSNQLRRLRN